MTLAEVGGAAFHLVRVLAALYVAAGILLLLVRNRITFPAPREVTPEPARYGMPDGAKVVIPTPDGARLVCWYLPPREVSAGPAPAVVWFHGNGETVGALAPLLREFRPARAALLVATYRGYGESSGRPTPALLERDTEALWRWLTARAEVDPARIVVYGRSVGTGPATFLAATHPVAGLILESGFTSLRALARVHYPIFPSVLAGRRFDNLRRIAEVRAPVLFIHGDADRLIPIGMGRALAARAGQVRDFWVIPGADHNETYLRGGDEYVRRFAAFVEGVTR